MVELQKLKDRALADGSIGDHEVEFICRELYPEGRIDKEVVDFLLTLRNEARSVCTAFEQFLCDAVKHHVLRDGFSDPDEARWLRQTLFADRRRVGKREKQLLRELKHEASHVSIEFQKLYDEFT
jgi:hypothetical protein